MTWTRIKTEIIGAWKAVVAFVVPGLAVLAGFLVGDLTIGDLTQGQWLAIAIAMLGTPAAVYLTPNK